MKYSTPAKYYYRIHHARPRFKNNVEAVLLYVADAISSAGEQDKDDFKQFLIDKLYRFPGNQTRSLKTIQNWRTEISALFSLYYDEKDKSLPSSLAIDLSTDQDLTKFFKYFLYSFQYPAGHIKPKEVQLLKKKKILFHPANYFLRVITELNIVDKSQGYLSRGEACHMIFNDLRASTDYEYKNIKDIAKRIVANRHNKIVYDLAGDVIRYASDILDYMSLANILKNYAGKFYLNKAESRSIKKFLNNKSFFTYENATNIREVFLAETDWVKHVSQPVVKQMFETDIIAFIANDEQEYKKLLERTSYIKMAEMPGAGARTKDTGDYGEALVYGHECQTLKIGRREDLIRWVQCIPSHFAVGYDIQSVDIKESRRYIEVKSTLSQKKITFNKFNLTKSELSSAQSLGHNYFIYRLQINKDSEISKVKLTIIPNPIQLFKESKIDIDLSTGEINLKNYKGLNLELLYWESVK